MGRGTDAARPRQSLASAFGKDVTIDRDYLWWLHEGNRAIRVGDWKLVAAKNDPWELYDLKIDRAESINLISSQPEKAKALEKLWNRQLDKVSEEAAKTAPEQPAPRRKKKAKN